MSYSWLRKRRGATLPRWGRLFPSDLRLYFTAHVAIVLTAMSTFDLPPFQFLDLRIPPKNPRTLKWSLRVWHFRAPTARPRSFPAFRLLPREPRHRCMANLRPASFAPIGGIRVRLSKMPQRLRRCIRAFRIRCALADFAYRTHDVRGGTQLYAMR